MATLSGASNMKKVMAVLVAALVFAGVSRTQAAMFGINLSSSDSNSTIPLTLSDGPTVPLTQTKWNNWNVDTAGWVSQKLFMSDGKIAPTGITVSWGYNHGLSAWAGIDNDGSILPEPGRSGVPHNTLDYTGVGGQYNAWVKVSGLPPEWGLGTNTIWGLGDEYGGLCANYWDSYTGTNTFIEFDYPHGDGRWGGFIKAVQISGPNVKGSGGFGSLLVVR